VVSVHFCGFVALALPATNLARLSSNAAVCMPRRAAALLRCVARQRSAQVMRYVTSAAKITPQIAARGGRRGRRAGRHRFI